jgi:hypothetical protein
METTGLTNRIHVSSDFASYAKHLPLSASYLLEKREDIVDVKGKGKMTTYWLDCAPYYELEREYPALFKSTQELITNFVFVKPELLTMIARNNVNPSSTEEQSLKSLVPLHRDQSADSITFSDHTTQSATLNVDDTVKFSELVKFEFDIFRIHADDALSISYHILSIFEGIFDLASIDVDKRILSNFIRRVSRSYRAVPYHNYHHAFCVVQFTAAQLVQCNFIIELPQKELFCLLICALIHDIGNYCCY